MKCKMCNGEGQIRIHQYSKFGKVSVPEKTDIVCDCPACNGSGKTGFVVE